MPCYNAAPFVAEAVGSALSQTHSSVELIVVDDGSSDGSREKLEQLAQQYGPRLVVLSQQNKGPFPARNLGLRHASGEFIAFLDADDYWDLHFLERLHSALAETGADAAYCGWQNVGDFSGNRDPYLPPCYEDGDPVRSFLQGCPWPIHAALTRRRVIDQLGGFSERYFSALDYDLWIRMLAVTRKIVKVPEVMAFYRWHGGGQISRVKWRQTLDAWNVRRDFVAANPDLVAHLDRRTLVELVDGFLLKSGYTAYWKRDLPSAWRLFRPALSSGHWSLRDLRYLVPALLPERMFTRIVGFFDGR